MSTGTGGVTELRLSGNRLKGKIPPVLGNMSGLTRLELRGGTGGNDNQLIGSIPAELGNLVNLTHLDLANNQMGGQIPSELGNLTNLTHLDLSNNGLTGIIPAGIGNLTNLVFLDLSGNKMSGNIPASLGKLKSSIETLLINNTGLEGCIPDDLKYVQSSSTDIPQVNLSLSFCSEYTPPPTPRPTTEGGSTPEPGTSTSGNGPTPTPKPTTPIGQPTVNFHASQTEVLLGEPVLLTLSVANSIIKPEMTLQLVLQLPSGILVSGEGGIGEECSVQCVGIYKVVTGENKDFLLTAVANQPGSFDIDGRMEWYFGNENGYDTRRGCRDVAAGGSGAQAHSDANAPTDTHSRADAAAARGAADGEPARHADGGNAGRPSKAAALGCELDSQARDDAKADPAGTLRVVHEGIRVH